MDVPAQTLLRRAFATASFPSRRHSQSAARALKKFATQLSAEEMVRESLGIAADVCIYTNHNQPFIMKG